MMAHSLLVEVIIGTFLDAVATVHVLTASNNDVKLNDNKKKKEKKNNVSDSMNILTGLHIKGLFT